MDDDALHMTQPIKTVLKNLRRCFGGITFAQQPSVQHLR
jgi:hypothetical protein